MLLEGSPVRDTDRCAHMPLNLQAEHGVDAGPRGFDGRIAAFERGQGIRLAGNWLRSCRLLCGGLNRLNFGGSGCCGARSDRIGSYSGRLGSRVLEVSEIASLFGAGLNGRKGQVHLMFHGAGDAVQLPDELVEFLGTAEVQVTIPKEADGQDNDDGQADGEGGENNFEEQGIER